MLTKYIGDIGDSVSVGIRKQRMKICLVWDKNQTYYENRPCAVSSKNNVSCFRPRTYATPPTNIKDFRYANAACFICLHSITVL